MSVRSSWAGVLPPASACPRRFFVPNGRGVAVNRPLLQSAFRWLIQPCRSVQRCEPSGPRPRRANSTRLQCSVRLLPKVPEDERVVRRRAPFSQATPHVCGRCDGARPDRRQRYEKYGARRVQNRCECTTVHESAPECLRCSPPSAFDVHTAWGSRSSNGLDL